MTAEIQKIAETVAVLAAGMTPSTNRDPLHSIDSAARYLGGISPHTIRFYLKRRRLAKVKVGGRTMIRQSELDRFISGEAQ